MNCCPVDTTGADRFFSKHAKRYAKRFRKNGLDKCQQLLYEGIALSGLRSRDVLEVGCGVGGLLLTLLKEGAGEAFGVEVSRGMLEQARKLAKEMGCEERVHYHLGDFVSLSGSGQAPRCDITVLDKVLCCYEDWKSLVEQSIAKTNAVYAVSFPRLIWYNRLFFHFASVLAKMFRWSFHPFYHDWERVQLFIAATGYSKKYENHTVMWLVQIYEKNNGR